MSRTGQTLQKPVNNVLNTTTSAANANANTNIKSNNDNNNNDPTKYLWNNARRACLSIVHRAVLAF